MSLVQRLKGDQLTFGDVAMTVLSMAMKEGVRCNRIHVVFHTYKELSIKNSERQLRGEESGHQLVNITSTQIVRQWRNFLTRVRNKTSLITFIVNEWRKKHADRSWRRNCCMPMLVIHATESPHKVVRRFQH